MISQERIDAVLAVHRNLCRDGLGRPTYISPADWPAHLISCREALRREVRGIDACEMFLAGTRPTHGHGLSSYAGKHRIERALEALGAGMHVSNGAFIVASLLCGFTLQPTGAPNVLVDVHGRYLAGKRSGMPYRVALSEKELFTAGSLVARVDAAARHSRGGVSVVQLARPDEDTAALDRLLVAHERIATETGRYLVRRPDQRHNRWITAEATTTRPALLAAQLHFSALSEELGTTIGGLSAWIARMSPAEAAAPVSFGFVRAAQNLENTLRELISFPFDNLHFCAEISPGAR